MSAAFSEVQNKAASKEPTPQKIALLCEIHEMSASSKVDKMVFRFLFDSLKYPNVKDERKSLLAYSVWLDDGSDIEVTEIDATNESYTKWLPKIFQKKDEQARHYFLSVTVSAEGKAPTEVAHIPVEDFVFEKGQPMNIDLGSNPKGGGALTLKCSEFR